MPRPTAYILHGICDEEEYLEEDFPSPSNAHWLPWLQQKFLRAGHLCQCLEMPFPPKPVYEDWRQTWAQAQLSEASTIVTLSAGGGFILKWLAENPSIKLNKLIMVAPWLDPNRKCGDFLQTTLDPTLTSRINQIHILTSENDHVLGIPESFAKLKTTYPTINIHMFPTHGHFCLSNTGPTFPELWQICAT